MANSTIYDVSRRAGVSTATVSRVLNSPKQVNIETRERVILAIDELNFIPKFEALTRARKAVGRIGILTPYPTSNSFVERMDGILEALKGLPYELVIFNVDSQAQRDRYFTSLALTHAVDGLIIALPINDAIVKRLIKHQLPVVQIVDVGTPCSPELNSITIDHARGASLVAEYLAAKGHRRIGFIGDTKPPDFMDHTSEVKLDSFRKTLAEAGIPLPNANIGLSKYSMESAFSQAHQLLQLPNPPTAIFASSDSQAIGVLGAAREKKLNVPGDLAVVGYDDIEVAKYIGLTTVHQNLKLSGQRAIELLLETINDFKNGGQIIAISQSLIERSTS